MPLISVSELDGNGSSRMTSGGSVVEETIADVMLLTFALVVTDIADSVVVVEVVVLE